MADYYVGQGDTQPALTATIVDDNAVAIDITGASVSLVAKMNATVLFNNAVVITDAPNGKVSYQWLTPDTVTSGIAMMQFHVQWAAGGVSTFPVDHSLVLNITPKLG